MLRVAIPGLAAAWLLGDWALTGTLTEAERSGLIIASCFFAFATALVLHILATADRYAVPRRLLGIVADNIVNTYFMLVMGERGAIVVGIYLFITFGNGFRYGRLYLHICQAFSLLGFAFVLYASDFWSNHLAVGLGFLMAMLVLPFYVGVLAERINEAKKKADEANQAKGRFLANVSHEMRTPLNGVIAMVDLLRETPLQEAQREIVDTLSTSAQLALTQIEGILDAAKIEAGRVQLELRPFDLGRLLTSAVKVVLPQARYKGLEVKTEVSQEASGWFNGDAHHLRQVLLNLLSNAVKFTDRGEIRLVAKVVSSLNDVAMLRIEVIDTGIGIPESKHATIFEPFSQADDSVTRVYGGTGLGTTIARQLITLMGGELGVQSKENVGSTFWINLPLPLAEPQGFDATAELAATRGVPTAGFAVSGPSASVHKIGGVRVLVAEDNPTNQRVTRMILESAGHVATIVSNGEEALNALERARFDIALFDLSMPVVSGLEALKLYRFAEADPIPVIVLSANVTTDTIAECERAGAAEFVAKPVRASLLLDAIARNIDERSANVTPPVVAGGDERPSLTVVQTPALDPKVMEELRQFSTDPTFVERLIQGFIADCERLTRELETALSQRKYEAVKDAAHALRGGAGSIGATQLMQFATKVDKATPETMRLKSTAWVAEMRDVVAKTMASLDSQLRSELNRAKSS
jgi:two-component system sensor histidine kinase RpfC